MTDIVTSPNSPERLRRISERWGRSPGSPYHEVAEEVDAELAEEAERQAEADTKTRELTASLNRMWSCPVCGGNAMHTGLCDDCRRVETVILVERSAAIPVRGGVDRRAAVEAWMERLGR